MKTKLLEAAMPLLFGVIAIHAQQDTQTLDSLIQDAISKNPDVASRAAAKLIEKGGGSVPKLFAFILDENDKALKLYGSVAEAALDSQNFNKAKVEASRREAKEHDSNVNVALVIAGKIGTPAVAPLLDCLKNEYPFTRLRLLVAEQLAIIGDKRAIGPLVATLSDGGSEQKKREAAMNALAKITGQAFGHDDEKWEAWWETTGSGKSARNPAESLNRTVVITDAGQVYSFINRGDSIPWPTEAMKKLGGESGWGSFRPKNGDQGVIVAEVRHPDTRLKLYILKVSDYFVVIPQRGVKVR